MQYTGPGISNRFFYQEYFKQSTNEFNQFEFETRRKAPWTIYRDFLENIFEPNPKRM